MDSTWFRAGKKYGTIRFFQKPAQQILQLDRAAYDRHQTARHELRLESLSQSRVVKSIEVYGDMHRFIPVLAKWAGFKKIGEKVVKHQERKYGVTKFGLNASYAAHSTCFR
jgi:hypothetical protein